MQLSSDALAQITAILQEAEPDYVAAYNLAQSDLQSQIVAGTLTPSSDDLDVLRWLDIASQVNSGQPTFAALGVRINNAVAYKLETNKDISIFGPEEQASSNAVAASFFSRVISAGGVLPPFSGSANAIMFIDAQAGLGSLNLGPEAWAGAIPNAADPGFWTGFNNDNYFSTLSSSQQQEAILIHAITATILSACASTKPFGYSIGTLDSIVTYMMDSTATGLQAGANILDQYDSAVTNISNGVVQIEDDFQNIYNNLELISDGSQADNESLDDVQPDESSLYGADPNASPATGTYDAGPGFDLQLASSTGNAELDGIDSKIVTGDETISSDATGFFGSVVAQVTVTVGSVTCSGTYTTEGVTTTGTGLVLSGITIGPSSLSVGSLSFTPFTELADGSIVTSAPIDDSVNSEVSNLAFVAGSDGSLSIYAVVKGETIDPVIKFPAGQITGQTLNLFDFADNFNNGPTTEIVEFGIYNGNPVYPQNMVIVLAGATVNTDISALPDGTPSSYTYMFASPDSVINLEAPFLYHGSIENFQAGDTIDLQGLAAYEVLGDSVSVELQGGDLSVQVWGTVEQTFKVILEQDIPLPSYLGYVPQDISVSSDENGGLDVTTSSTGPLIPVPDGLPCFVRGSRIATSRGERLVETLRPGELLPTASGECVPILWIGQRRIDCGRYAEPRLVWPVRVRAAAFGAGLPKRDLWLSPDHAVFVDELLIPIKHLVNGVTIEQVRMDEVTYYHVELARHDVLYAEGMPVESYLDTGNRTAFENGGAQVALHPDFEGLHWEAEGCAPLVVTGGRLRAVQQWVNTLAAARMALRDKPGTNTVRAA